MDTFWFPFAVPLNGAKVTYRYELDLSVGGEVYSFACESGMWWWYAAGEIHCREREAEAHSALPERPLEGFGTHTPGGSGGVPYVVTSLADAGPGTLRDAVAVSNRYITFDVTGTVALASAVSVVGEFITLDGRGSPVTITAAGALIGPLLNLRGCNDVVVRNIRIRDNPDVNAGDNLRIWDGAYNVVIDHCSFRRAGDGNIDISDSAHDITVQWSILGDTVKNSLIRTGLTNISLHHNLFVAGDERNPQLDNAEFVDMVNNVIYGWATNYGTRIRNGSTANVVANYYIPDSGSDVVNTLVLEPDSGPVYISGNAIPAGCPVVGTAPVRYAAPPVTQMSLSGALAAVLAEAGCWPRDTDDVAYVAMVEE